MKPIVICGAAGQIGRELAQRAPGLLCLTRGDLDITHAGAVESVLKAYQPSVVINAAAFTAVDKAESERGTAHCVNADGPRNLARSCRQIGAALLQLSTDYVFNGEGDTPWTPTSPAMPLGVYGLTKYEGELAVREVLQQHLILRVSWVFGPHGSNFVRTMVRAASERPELRVVADQTGGPTYAGDIANVLLALAEGIVDGRPPAWGTYHYCGTPVVSWYDFAKTIIERAVHHRLLVKQTSVVPIATADYPTPARRPRNSVLDCSATKVVLGITQPDWRVGLDETLTIWKRDKT